MGGWYRCERQDCDKTFDDKWAVEVYDDGVRHVYCSEECAELDGKELK